MKKLILVSVISITATSFLTSCETKKEESVVNSEGTVESEEMASDNDSSAEIENTDVVPSGTYSGIAKKVDPEEKEIYVETADGKILELYFTDDTNLTKNGEKVTFDKLKQNGKVEVTVEKKGNRLEPKDVKILD